MAQITKDAIQIIATMGDHQLGGKDWDIAICKWAAEQFAEEYGEDFSYDKEQMDALMVDAETLKRNLTNKSQADIRVNYNGSRGSYTLTEAEFRKRTRPLVEHTGKLIRDMFAENHLSWNDIDDVILVGGSTRMTMIEDYITELQGKPALRGINADEAVALVQPSQPIPLRSPFRTSRWTVRLDLRFPPEIRRSRMSSPIRWD